MQTATGAIVERSSGTPQGGVVSSLLANLFLHYAFDMWVTQNLRSVRFCRYADDCAPRRRRSGRKPVMQPCCTRDGGGPSGIAVQAEIPNHLLLLHLRGVVVSEPGKGGIRSCQIRFVESNANEPLMNCRKRRDDVKTGRESLAREKSGKNLFTDRAASGINKGGENTSQALVWNVGTCHTDAKGATQGETLQASEYRCGVQGRSTL